ncbi:ty3-gypsy retrotransposon protein [Tanacetum coccineum]
MDDLVQDFFIRPEGDTFDLDVYESYTNLFTIKCHYYGKFNDGPKKEYIEGETCFVDLVNRDQFTDVVLNTVINSLGYEMEDEVLYWYKIPLKSLDVGLKPLVSESDYRRFLGYVGSQFFSKLDLRSEFALEHLTIVLRCLQEHQQYVKFSKCLFGQQRIEYLGHIVTGAGVEMDPLKITAVKDWPVPSSKALILAPVLRLPDFSKPFIVETDASGYEIGAILSQDGHPIAFFSKKLSKRMQQTSAYVRELYAITEATLQTPEQEAFLPKLLGYQFTIEYNTRHSNTAADGLSRSCHMAISVSHSSIVDTIRDSSISSPFVSSLVQDIRNNGEEASCYSSKNGLLYWKDRVVVPLENDELLKKLLVEFHSSTIGGHASFQRTYARIATYFYWPGMRRTIREFVRRCQICQRAKSSQLHLAGLLSPLPIPNQVWEDVAMDFITGIPNSKGYTVIMVVIDRLSKYAHFASLRANYTAHQVAELFVQTVVKLHGIPRFIVYDRDKVFTNAFWSHLFKFQGTSLNMSSAYHPQTDGQSEALNKCLELYLRCFVFYNPRAWVAFLLWAKFWYNSAFHTSIGMTPFKVLYGRDPPSIIPCSVFEDTPSDVQTQLQASDVVLSQLLINIIRAQSKMKKYVDKKRRKLEFAVGDFVYVKLQLYRQLSVKLQRNQKLGDPGAAHVPLPLLSTTEGPLLQPVKLLDTAFIRNT